MSNHRRKRTSLGRKSGIFNGEWMWAWMMMCSPFVIIPPSCSDAFLMTSTRSSVKTSCICTHRGQGPGRKRLVDHQCRGKPSSASKPSLSSSVLFLHNWDAFYDHHHDNDHFFDEANELFAFMDMVEDDDKDVQGGASYIPTQYDSISHFGGNGTNSNVNSNSLGQATFTSHVNVNTAKNTFINATIVHANKDEKVGSREIQGAENITSENISFEEDQDIDMVDNLIVPDLETLLSNIQLAPASEIAYFYLQNTIGLESEVMWKITNEAGSILGFTVQNLEEKISLLKRLINLSDEDMRQIITKHPSILHMSGRKNISPTVLFLVRAMDLSKQDLRSMVVAYPCILCYSIQNLGRKIGFFEEVFGFNQDEMRELIVSEPRLMTCAVDSETGLMARFQFLNGEMRIPLKDLKDIVKANPKIMLYSVRKNLQAKLISFFVMRLQMEPKHITKLLKSYPYIIDYSLEEHMLPIARFFLGELEFSPFELRKIVLKFPRLMTHSLFKIKHTVGYLRYQLGMNAEQVKRVLFQAPQVISLSTDDTLVSKVSFLRDAFGLEEGSDLRKVIVGMPTLLLCSVEKNLSPKADFLLQHFDGDQMEIRQAVLTLPTLLGYSLDKRIRPRMARLLDIGAEPIKITVGITMTDENFDIWLENKRNRIKNNGHLSTRKRRSKNTEHMINSSSIVQSDSESRPPLSGRIIHWKRS